MFGGGDPNPTISPPGLSGPSASPNPMAGRFFVNTIWRPSENKPRPTSTEDNIQASSSDSSISSRQGFGTFGKALQQLRKESSPRKKQNTSLSNVDVLSLQSIYVSDVPDHLLEKHLLLRHFSQYGDIARITISVKRKSCTLHFENHDMAEKAKTHGATLEGIALNIYWSRPSSVRRSERSHSDSSSLSEVERSLKAETSRLSKEIGSGDMSSAIRKSEKRHHDHSLPKFDLPDDVQDELRAMAMVTYSPNSPDDRPMKSQKKSPKKESPSGSRPKHDTKKKINLGEMSTSRSSSRSKPATATVVESETVYGTSLSMEELQKIMRSASHSAEERYRVLDTRDKLMRMKRVRQSDIMKARGNRGTCPDLCPEKERYQREYQRQVAGYEQLLPGKMDNTKAVKQYLRSSADQEEPLSHELRPAPVLRMTMDYLIWALMDLCNRKDEHMGDWYYYIWDRTRSIRKDITQQDLCDETSVTLVEQCVRFHIFCSERMIAEDLTIYDDKINTENLTKCLQTLKYMYHDLSLKGVSCPNEAEFRAYFVLLNLSEGDCMWEVQQLSVEVRQAEPVRFALQVSAALSSNNFVRFFKLVRSSTYLNACILHRYFAQVRSQALSTILKAYCSRVDTVFTLDEVVCLTGFENIQEAALLCSHHGLQLTQDGTGVVFSRHSYFQPDSVLTTARNQSLFKDKYPGSVAIVVSGCTSAQSDFLSHIPHDSFDGDGFLKAEAWKGIDQDSKATVKETSESASIPVVTDEVTMVSMHYREPLDVEAQMRRDLLERALQKQAEQAANDIITQVVEDEVCSIVEESVKDAHIDEATNGLFNEVFDDVITDLIQGLCKEVITAELFLARERMQAKQLALEADMRNKLIENKALLVFTSALDSAIKEICEGVMEEELARDAASIRWTDEIFQEVVQEQCKEALEVAVAEARTLRLDAIRARVRARQLAYFFQKWRFFVNKSKRLQESMCDFPAWMSNMSLDEQVSELEQPDPCFLQHLTDRRRSKEKSKPDLVDGDLGLPSLPTISVGSAIALILVQRMKKLSCYNAKLFWKSVISLPDEKEAPSVSDSCNRWTHSIFVLDGTSTLLSQTKTNTRETVTTCLRCVKGPVTDIDACGGINGVFFWLSHKEASTRTVCQRLLAVLSAKPPRPAIPVAFVWTGPVAADCESAFIRELALEKLKESNFLSQYKFFRRNGNTHSNLANQMESACRWLAQCTPCYPPLVVTSMRQLVNQCLTDELWEHIYDNNSNRSPNSMVELYNTALSKLEEHLNDANLKQYSLGAAEFCTFLNDDYVYREQFRYQISPEYCGGKQYFATIAKFLSDARLDSIEPWPPQSSQDLKKSLGDYCTLQGVPHIIGDIYLILERHLSSKRASFPPSSTNDWKMFLKTLPWSRVLQTVAEAKLESLECGFVSRNLSSQDGLLVVVYRKSFRQFRCFPWWITKLNSPHSAADVFESCEKREAVTHKRQLVNETESPNKQQRLSLSDTLTKIKMVVSKLDSTMKCAKITREAIEAKYESP